jgi:DNA-nicking Smr family endonuclease
MARPVAKKEVKKEKVVDIKKSTKEREKRKTNKKEEVVSKKKKSSKSDSARVKYILPDDFQDDLTNSFLKIEKALKNARAPMNRFIDAHVKSAVPEARKYLQAVIVAAKELRKMLQQSKSEVKAVKK